MYRSALSLFALGEILLKRNSTFPIFLPNMPVIKATDRVHDISVIFLRVNNGKKRKVSVHTGIKVIFIKRIVYNFSSSQKTVLIVNILKFLVKSPKRLPN